MCLDAEGQIWFANAISISACACAEGGEMTGTVKCSKQAYACMLGGEDRRTLFVMTAGSSDRFEIAEKTGGRIEAGARRGRAARARREEASRGFSRVRQRLAQVADCLRGAQFVLDQGEAHVRVTALAEADAGTGRHVGRLDEERARTRVIPSPSRAQASAPR